MKFFFEGIRREYLLKDNDVCFVEGLLVFVKKLLYVNIYYWNKMIIIKY